MRILLPLLTVFSAAVANDFLGNLASTFLKGILPQNSNFNPFGTEPLGFLQNTLKQFTQLSGASNSPLDAMNLFKTSGDLLSNPMTANVASSGLGGALEGAGRGIGHIGLADRTAYKKEMQECKANMDANRRKIKELSGNILCQGGLLQSMCKSLLSSNSSAVDLVLKDLTKKEKDITRCVQLQEEKNKKQLEKKMNQFTGKFFKGNNPLSSVLGLGNTVDRSQRTPNLLSGLFQKQTANADFAGIANFGDVLKLDAEELCKKATDVEFRECAQQSENYCLMVEEVSGILDSVNTNSPNIFDLTAKMTQITNVIRKYNNNVKKIESSKRNCGCMGRQIRKSLGPARRLNTKANNCISSAVSRVGSEAKSGAAEGVAFDFFKRLQPGKEVPPILPSSSQGINNLLKPDVLSSLRSLNVG